MITLFPYQPWDETGGFPTLVDLLNLMSCHFTPCFFLQQQVNGILVSFKLNTPVYFLIGHLVHHLLCTMKHFLYLILQTQLFSRILFYTFIPKSDLFVYLILLTFGCIILEKHEEETRLVSVISFVCFVYMYWNHGNAIKDNVWMFFLLSFKCEQYKTV